MHEASVRLHTLIKRLSRKTGTLFNIMTIGLGLSANCDLKNDLHIHHEKFAGPPVYVQLICGFCDNMLGLPFTYVRGLYVQ